MEMACYVWKFSRKILNFTFWCNFWILKIRTSKQISLKFYVALKNIVSNAGGKKAVALKLLSWGKYKKISLQSGIDFSSIKEEKVIIQTICYLNTILKRMERCSKCSSEESGPLLIHEKNLAHKVAVVPSILCHLHAVILP